MTKGPKDEDDDVSCRAVGTGRRPGGEEGSPRAPIDLADQEDQED